MDVSAKLAPTFSYDILRQFWASAEDLGFHGIYDYDHFYGLDDDAVPTFEGWTTLAALAAVTQRARVGCIVSSVTFRHPAVLANMAVTVDHISGGRLEFGIGAGWHDAEHRAYGLVYPGPGDRVAMLDEALTVIRRLWTESAVTHRGRFFTLEDAVCNPKPLQDPHPPIMVGAALSKMLRVVARHADEWNMPMNGGLDEWSSANAMLDRICAEEGRDSASIRRSVQLFLHPQRDGHVSRQLKVMARLNELGCHHVVLSFYQPPTDDQLRLCAAAAADLRK
ncbi:LLM class flavin-dependent oxidoreductase [Mycobacterium sp. GA-2829]|uniref:LLM class flavin-dependent oxidoreductase n=1 Tax=Mycobacterium sp. GA-2829 TaxID=1772283 RepID=UPI00074015E1|nr:LLM class flavin-dependent oxidoreductase [Mycobacterium sp. GA-2829]KUI31718.1 LLM class F420-dependent oxidoreductase [Mycobacterium sp. GA-2829]